MDLPNSEMEVLAWLWHRGSGTTRDVCDGLAPHRKMGLAAAQTLLLRLESKGLVRREKIAGRNAFRYSPTRQAEPVCRQQARQVVDRLFGGSAAKLMASLFASRKPGPDEIRQMEKLLREIKQRGK